MFVQSFASFFLVFIVMPKRNIGFHMRDLITQSDQISTFAEFFSGKLFIRILTTLFC
jgi:hypothetical protein